MSKAERVKRTAVAPSLGAHLLELTEQKWGAGRPPEEANLERYRGILGYRPDGSWITSSESMANGCIAFCHEVLGVQPKAYQEDIIRRLYRRRRCSVRGPRGLGKSAVASWTIIHFAAVHDICKIPTTAGSWAQLENFLWPEINLWAGRADWTLIGRKPKMNLLDMSFGGSEDGEIKPTSTVFAIRSDEPQKVEGAHSRKVLIVFDEAKAIEDAMFDALEGTLSKGDKYALNLSTPGAPTGRFYFIQSRKPGFEDWDARHVTFEEVRDGIVDDEERASYITWAEQRKKQWGEDSPMYRNHVLGEFADTTDEYLIPLAWVEAAQGRWREWRAAGFPALWAGAGPTRKAGADCAGDGKDKTAIALRHGNAILKVLTWPRQDPMETANRLMKLALEGYTTLQIEIDGPGTGIMSRCREMRTDNPGDFSGVTLVPLVSGSKTEATDMTGELRFYNLRSRMWWRMRELLDPSNGSDVMLPDMDELTAELTCPKWEIKEGGKIKVESKPEIRKRLAGKSTDHADAVIFAFTDDAAPVIVSTVRVAADVAQQTPKGGNRPGTWYDARGGWPGFRRGGW